MNLESDVIHLAPTPPPIRPLLRIVGWPFLMLVSIALMMSLEQYGVPRPPLLAVGAVGGALFALWCELEWRRRGRASDIELGPEGVGLPLGLFESRVVRIPYEQLTRVDQYGRGGLHRVFIDTEDRHFQVLASRLPSSWSAERLCQELLRRVEATGGAAAVALLEERNRRATCARVPLPRATTIFACVLLAAGTGQWAYALVEPDFGRQLLRLGANVKELVFAGQIWRVVTANLLHIDVVHFTANLSSIMILGRQVEGALGGARFAVLMVVSALVGSTTSSLFGSHLASVGASTMVFGLIGAITVLRLHFGKELPLELRPTSRDLALLLVLNIIVLPIVARVESWGHGGGFIAGLGVALAFSLGRSFPDPSAPVGAATKAVLLVVLVIVLSALVAAALTPLPS